MPVPDELAEGPEPGGPLPTAGLILAGWFGGKLDPGGPKPKKNQIEPLSDAIYILAELRIPEGIKNKKISRSVETKFKQKKV